MKKIKWFEGHLTSLEGLKKRYRKLVKNNHPDKADGSKEKMIEINNEYDYIIEELEAGRIKFKSDKKNNNKNNTIDLKSFKKIINKISHLPVAIEIVGSWVWVSGDTYNHKEELKKNNFRWSSKQKKWYWFKNIKKSKKRKKASKKSYKEIKACYGSKKVKEANKIKQLDK